DSSFDALMVRGDKNSRSGICLTGTDPYLFRAKVSGFRCVEVAWMQHQRLVHRKDRPLAHVVSQLERRLHSSYISDDGERVGFVTLVDLRKRKLLCRRCQLLDLR